MDNPKMTYFDQEDVLHLVFSNEAEYNMWKSPQI
jgi:hypothetical protein